MKLRATVRGKKAKRFGRGMTGSKNDLTGEVSALVIENVVPQIDGGKFPVKGIQGDLFPVEADIFKEAHDSVGVALLYKEKGGADWEEAPMVDIGNDRWHASFTPEKNARYVYTIEAWLDPMACWLRDMEKRCEYESFVNAHVAEGLGLLDRMQERSSDPDRKEIRHFKERLARSDGSSQEILSIIHDERFRKAVAKVSLREQVTRYSLELELVVDRPLAAFSSWYEMFPRSQGRKAGQSGTFRDCVERLPDIKKMGFNVIYLPPIHPVGITNRKGPNNELMTDGNSPGSPWAIGNEEGGHKAIHPDLGTMKDFQVFLKAARGMGIEIALDYAIQCSPDHPYVREHSDWFYRLPDGTIRYAENPPKKYQDIYPVNFYGEHRKELMDELKSILLFWIEKGVRIFRADNPHTKPLRFWKWLIDEVQQKHPDVIFLSEAFTRPKVMKYLAKAGFSQSYTYFTWRNTKSELREYLEELTGTEMKHYFRPNFFANTPDILHEVLQKGGQAAFKMRLVLAATLSASYGIYNGFELCEDRAKEEGSEEYLNSEKYEYKVWDWNRPGNIKDFIARVNQIRAENPALQRNQNLRFYPSHNDRILCYEKRTADGSNTLVVVVNLDPFHEHEDLLNFPIWDFGIEGWQTYRMEDLLTGQTYDWKGSENYVRLDPKREPAHIFLLKK